MEPFVLYACYRRRRSDEGTPVGIIVDVNATTVRICSREFVFEKSQVLLVSSPVSGGKGGDGTLCPVPSKYIS